MIPGITASRLRGVSLVAPTVLTTSSGFNNVSSNNTVVTLPAGVVAGNFLLVFFSVNTTNLSTFTVTAGWSTLVFPTNAGTGSTVLCYKIATGSDALTVTTPFNRRWAYIALRLSSGTNFDITSFIKGGSGTNYDPPLHTPSQGNREYLFLSGFTSLTGVPVSAGPPPGYTSAGSIQSGSTGPGAALCVGYRTATASSEDPGIGSINAQRSCVPFTMAVW